MIHENNKTPFILIFGSGRSGTTLVREILNRHSKVNVLPETGFYDRLWAARRWLGPVRCKDCWVRWLYYILYESYDPEMKNYQDAFSALVEEFSRKAPERPADMFIRVTQTLGMQKGKSIVGEKTPRHVLYAGTIFEQIPESLGILVVRDPRAVVASMVKRGDLADEVWKAAVEWRLSSDRSQELIAKYRRRILVVSYEQLVLKPRDEITRLCRFLGIDIEDQMEEGGAYNSSYGLKAGSGISTDSLDKWKDVLGPEEIHTIERIAGVRLEEFGYKPQGNVLSRLEIKENLLYLRYQAETFMGHLGIRPNRAYLRHLKCKVWL